MASSNPTDNDLDLQEQFATGVPLNMAWIEVAPPEDRENLHDMFDSREYDDAELKDQWRYELITLLRKGRLIAIGRSHDHFDQLQILRRSGCNMQYFSFPLGQFNAPNQRLHDVVVVFPSSAGRENEAPEQPQSEENQSGEFRSVWNKLITLYENNNREIKLNRRPSFDQEILDSVKDILMKNQSPIHKKSQEQATREIRAKMQALFPDKFAKDGPSPHPETIRKFLRRFADGWFTQ